MIRPGGVNGAPVRILRTNHVEQPSNDVFFLQDGIREMNVCLDVGKRPIKTL